ncbi:MBL fold metallo-hydrolase [Paraburkholderia tropica]|uniref:ComEC/Rec2 family competence protein n=1 Tax=Paraburkholderia tropica TaxID=92647 RepID=UPI0032B5CEB8
MHLTVFDVQHGACALLTCDNGDRIMVDCGHNGTNDWRPGNYLAERNVKHLDLLVVTNYDEDHVSGLPNLQEKVSIGALLRNKTVSPDVLTQLKSDDGMGVGIDALVAMARRYTGELKDPPEFPLVKRQVFRNSYPDFQDENNLSLVLHLEIAGFHFLFPGDLEKAGWKALLENNQSFRDTVKKIDFLFAAHHGRENGLYEPLFEQYGCKPHVVIISDKKKAHQSQETTAYYADHVKGLAVEGNQRFVLTTRSDGTIRFDFNQNDRLCTVQTKYDMTEEEGLHT